MSKEFEITPEHKEIVDKHISLMERVSEFRDTYPNLYYLLSSQLIKSSRDWDQNQKVILPREVLRYKAIAQLLTDEVELSEKVKKELKSKKK